MSLADRFREGTEFDSVGRFTLDESRAKSKMARFQLTKKEEFLALLSQAAVAAGATEIEVVSGSEIRFVARGVNLDQEKCKRLESFIFDTSRQNISYFLLAVAVNALHPSCEEEPVVEVSDQVLIFRACLREPITGIESFLSRRLAYLGLPLTVDGKKTPTQSLEDMQFQLVQADSSSLTLVRFGVVVGLKIVSAQITFTAVVQDERLKMDASFSNVVEDHIYHELLGDLKERADKELAKAVGEHKPGLSNGNRYLKMLRSRLSGEAGVALWECPLFPLADREGWKSLEELRDLTSGYDTLLYSQELLKLVMDQPVVWVKDPEVERTLKDFFSPSQLKPAAEPYRRKLQAAQNREKWERNPRPTKLPPNVYLAKKSVEGKGWQAEIGYLGPPGGESHVDILYQKKLLCTEALKDVPPGATAVINFDEVEVNELWANAVGRDYRRAQRELKAELEKLFRHTAVKREQIYPELRNFLMNWLTTIRLTLPRIAEEAPLFRTLEGEWMSVRQLSELDAVALGDGWPFPRNLLGSGVIPKVIIDYSDQNYMALTKHLNGVTDIREMQERIRKIAAQLNNPVAPRIEEVESVSFSLMNDPRLKFEDEGMQGDIALKFERPAGFINVYLIFKGAFITTKKVKVTRLTRGWAAVRCDTLTPTADWTDFEQDKELKKLLSKVRSEAVELEKSLLKREDTPPERFLKLIEAYNISLEDYADRRIFESTRAGVAYSLTELRKEVEEHGELLLGPGGLFLPGRVILAKHTSWNSLRDSVLRDYLPKFTFRDGVAVVEAVKKEQEFQNRTVHREVKVDCGASYRYPLSSCKGEVVVFPRDYQSGYVDCYYGGRYICRKSDYIPSGCAAALDSEELDLHKDYRGCGIPAKIHKEILQFCEEGLLQGARTGDRKMASYAVGAVLKENPSREFLAGFDALEIFSIQGGGYTSVKRLKSEDGRLGYVQPSFSERLLTKSLTLRLDPSEVDVLKTRLGKRITKVEPQVLKYNEDLAYLKSIDLTFVESCSFQRTFKKEELEVRLGLGPLSSRAVGVDTDGNTLGHLDYRGLPAQVVVKGATKGKPDSALQPTAKLSKNEAQILKECVESAYLEWAEAIVHRRLTEEEHELALAVLNRTKHEIGSDQSHPQARLSVLLWSLPLFRREDKTWVSGEALAQELDSKGEPLPLSDGSWRVPGEALVDTGNIAILKNVLGEESLQIYQAPPLVDKEKIRDRIQTLVSWGIAPFRAVNEKLKDWAEEKEETPPPDEQKKKKKKRKRKKPKKPKADPEEIFLSAMKAEVTQLLGRHHYHRSNGFFKTVEMGQWILGPPIYYCESTNRFRFNRSHAQVKWLIHADSKTSKRALRVCRVLLVIHWVGLVNEASEELLDVEEHEFLVGLSEQLIHTFD